MKLKLFRINNWLIVGIVGLGISGCGGSSSESDLYSSDTAFASPFVSTSGSTQIDVSRAYLASTLETRRAQVQTSLNCSALSESDFDIDFANGLDRAECYGPQVTYTNHEDGAPDAGSLPTGDLGIWNATNSTPSAASTEACAAGQINSLIDAHGTKAHIANLVGARLLCFYRSQSKTLPAVGTSETLTAAELGVSGGGSAGSVFEFGSSGADVFTPTSASVTAEASGSNTLYRYDVSGSMTDNDSGKTMSFRVVAQHVRVASSQFRARLSYQFQDDSAQLKNCAVAPQGPNDTGTVVFAGYQTINKNSASDLILEFDHAEFCGADPLESDFTVDASSKFDNSTNPNGWANNYNYARFQFDPRSSAATYQNGNYAYAWQAGKMDNATRVFNVILTSESGAQTGTAYYGFGEDIAGSSGRDAEAGQMKGMICNWAGPGNTKTFEDKVQRQGLARNATSGLWEDVASLLKIKYAPTNRCQADPTLGSAMTYQASTGSPSSPVTDLDFDNDSDQYTPRTSEAETEDLLDISASKTGDFYIPFSSFPSAPTL